MSGSDVQFKIRASLIKVWTFKTVVQGGSVLQALVRETDSALPRSERDGSVIKPVIRL